MIEIRNLSKRFGDATAVEALTLRVAPRELLMLLGASGSGKTTTLKMVNRLIEPTAGSVWIDGRNCADVPAHELRRRIGYHFQQVGLFPHMTVADNVAVTPALLGWEAAGTAGKLHICYCPRLSFTRNQEVQRD